MPQGGVRLVSKLLFGFQAGSWNESRSSQRPPGPLTALSVVVLCFSAYAPAQVVTYEATEFPEKLGWERRPAGEAQGERRLEDGWYVQTLRLPKGSEGPLGETNLYRIELAGFAGVPSFFVEWRVLTDNPAWLLDLWQVPAALSASGNETTYHTTLTDSVARFLRHVVLPIVYVNIELKAPHTYRLEVVDTEIFTWYIDGQVLETGAPIRAYPDPTAFLIWGARRSYVDATTAWDYVRFGRIPDDASGDYDSDGAVTGSDYYFFHDCLTEDGPGIFGGPDKNAGPGCRFADFDADTAVNLLDFAEFQNLFNGPHP